MLQSDSTNSVIDLTFQETRSGFTRKHTTRMPHHPVVRTRSLPPDFPCLGLGNLGIPALVLPSGGMAARHRKGVTAELLSFIMLGI
ncbi:hypothetical protein CSKR_109621 [Clonorchis sinensis]|uniref:Uncharacterized protein n=1 Tax=Clonorchis sinensis TaxID=79923 RepID=A0A3R7CFQ4_CLOSI|nr:hypothetical protein CSKR_109621 [Clonorchis sinensis]